MTDDLVKRICQQWIDDGRADECFWEQWPHCPSGQDSLTPRMVFDRIEELEAKLANQEVYLKRISLAVYKDRRQETLDLIESTLAELTGGKDE